MRWGKWVQHKHDLWKARELYRCGFLSAGRKNGWYLKSITLLSRSVHAKRREGQQEIPGCNLSRGLSLCQVHISLHKVELCEKRNANKWQLEIAHSLT